MIKHKERKSFSEQQVLDCAYVGSPGDVYKYFKNAGGVATNEAYP